MSLRIAIVGACPYPVPQGSQVFLRDTARMLEARGHAVHLVVYGYGVGEDDSGLPVHRSRTFLGATKTDAGPSLVKPLLDAALVRTLRRVVREQRIDVVYAHNYEGLVVALAARKRPIVYQAHNAMADELPHFVRPRSLSRPVGSWLDRTFPRRADQVIVPHAALAEYLIACGCRPARLTRIAPPAVQTLFDADEPNGTNPPVLYTGNLDPYQNLGLLERVMKRVRREVPDARLVVATAARGEFPGADMVATPDFESLQRVLAQDAVVVCPRVSWSGYPIKLLNAMAAAKPVVACRGAAYPLVHRENGVVVDDNDEGAFANAVVELLGDPGLRRRLGQAARETVRADHAPEQIATQLEDVIISAHERARLITTH